MHSQPNNQYIVWMTFDLSLYLATRTRSSTRTSNQNFSFVNLNLKRFDVLCICTCVNYGLVMKKKRLFAYAKTETQISFAVTAKLISAFVFATWIVQSLLYLNPKFQALIHLLWLYSLVCIRPGRKPRRPVFSERGSIVFCLQPNKPGTVL